MMVISDVTEVVESMTTEMRKTKLRKRSEKRHSQVG